MTIEMLATLRRDELREDAEQHRLAQIAAQGQRPIYANVMVQAGKALNSAGEALLKNSLEQAEWELYQNTPQRVR